MTYRVEYNGDILEVTTLDAALESAKNAVATDVGPVSGWSVEHDETINDWFVQGVLHGEQVGPTAVVSGPEPTVASPARPAHDPDGWVRAISFTGRSPADAFAAAATWLARHPVAVTDASWSDGRLRVYLSDPGR